MRRSCERYIQVAALTLKLRVDNRIYLQWIRIVVKINYAGDSLALTNAFVKKWIESEFFLIQFA